MDPIDNVLGMDWTEARYIGDGVYMKNASEHTGIPSVALRTDREDSHMDVIVLEDSVFDELVRAGQAAIAYEYNRRRALDLIEKNESGD